MNETKNLRATIDGTLARLLADGVILCVRLASREGVIDACRAAAEGGLKTLEITLTTPGALEIIEALAADGELLVGAGTVLTPDDVVAVAEAGGRFALSPVFDPEVCDEARRRGLLAIPGASTPTEILAAHDYGAPAVKVFPSGALGGPAYLRAIRGPLGHVPMIPTSGPLSGDMQEWIDAGAVAVGVGPEVFTPDFTAESVGAAARRVRDAVDRARS